VNKRQPLVVRLYFQPPLYELARLIGYNGLPAPVAKEKLRALSERYGRAVMEAAVGELVEIDHGTEPPTARLTEAARKACWQLLGPPPATDLPARQTG
jgi:hypothetical protein